MKPLTDLHRAVLLRLLECARATAPMLQLGVRGELGRCPPKALRNALRTLRSRHLVEVESIHLHRAVWTLTAHGYAVAGQLDAGLRRLASQAIASL